MPDDQDFKVESFAGFIAAMALVASSVLPQPVQKALDMLPSDIRGNVQQVQVLAPKSNIRVNSGVECQAWVKPGDPNIYIHNWTDTYKKAEKGDRAALIRLAAAIAHEAYHQKHGPDELAAYTEQIRVLRVLGANNKDIKSIEAARDYVIARTPATRMAMKTSEVDENA